eukprot:jgi/Picre1/29119/NNA_004512.t1
MCPPNPPPPSPPSPPTLPGQPTDVLGYQDKNLVRVAWLDGQGGVPVETYEVRCGTSGTATCETAVVEVSQIARGVENGEFKGQGGKIYTCWVVALNSEGSVCSDVVQVQTDPPSPPPPSPPPPPPTPVLPGAPNIAGIDSKKEKLVINWTAGSIGIPEELYAVSCTLSGQSSGCPTGGPFEIQRPKNGSSKTTVDGITSGSSYTCWIVAHNDVGTVCSSPVQATPT